MANGAVLVDLIVEAVPRKTTVQPGKGGYTYPSGRGQAIPPGMGFEAGMGRYIDEILQPGEKVLYSTTIHGIIYVPGLLCLLLAAASVFGAQTVANEGLQKILWVVSALLAVIALFELFRAWFRRWIVETDVTSLRVVHKEGFIKRQTFEMSLDKIESVDVEQSIAGRIFGWGNVTVMGVGEGRKTIKMIASPLEFRNHITAR
jgi:uncharacterized membrane protein YdbT with pleckstrin-like domain